MYPQRRLRRLRKKQILPLLRETCLTKDDLVAPLFVDETADAPQPVPSMPGQFRYAPAEIAGAAADVRKAGIRAVLLFGIPAHKDAGASSAYDDSGVVQEAVRAIKREVDDIVVITDVCACEYTDHGHCGIIETDGTDFELLNDPSLALMSRIAVSHARAGADIVAPSCMLDGMVSAIRAALDREGYSGVPIMSYSSKFASSLYGPFRDAAGSGYSFGDRTGYQLAPGNSREALLESIADLEEGADILMVKPAGWYLDILSEVVALGLPVAAYQVSGEYAMIKAAGQNGWLDERTAAMESLICLKRAGADLIITYFAADAARWLDEE